MSTRQRCLFLVELVAVALGVYLLYAWFPSPQAQVINPVTVDLKDEGTSLGRITSLDCVGSGVACTVSGFAGTFTASGGAGSFAITQIEIDYDTCGIDQVGESEVCEVAITDAAISTSSKILIQQAGIAATSRDQDENEMDDLLCTADPQTGSFNLTCRSKDGPTHGKFKLWYSVA